MQPLTRTRAMRGTFDYRLEPEHESVGVGTLLRIPFHHRRELGVVIELAEHSELAPDKLAAPEAVVGVGLTPELVAMAQWMAREYCSTPARALSLMLAPGSAEGTGAKQGLVARITDAGEAALAPEHDDATLATLNDAQRALLLSLREEGPMIAARLGTPRLRRLESRGLVALEQASIPRRPAVLSVGAAPVIAPPLTGDQQAALDALLVALAGPDRPREGFLLHGVTGSGKTEVYLGAVEAVLAAGRTAIVLVPEIALTPQVLGRFQARFGDVVAVLHSALSTGERHDEWMRLRTGQARICVGARSAVLAPLTDVGLIVVDEEHESSYKHEGDPRYDARTLARARALHHGAVLVFGSATPRPESMVAMTRLSLPRRVDGRPMPPVQMLDMRGSHQPLHPETRNALADLRHAGGKAILLLNRRGWSNFLSCRSCGRVWLCPNCEVALVLHRHGGYVACHHCGHRELVPSRCPDCASVSVARHGAGTERIEHELREALGADDFPIFRLDGDGSTPGGPAAVLQAFGAAPSGVLVGTQMVAKGHDFPDVSLGVVLDADQTLRFPDFRAEERTFALVTQLAGRTGRGTGASDDLPGGRGPIAGRVLVQTLAPDARPLRYAVSHDSDGFVADELIRRRALSYPPYASLIRIVCSSQEEGPAREACEQIHARLLDGDATLLGPAPLFRLRDRHRTQLLIKSTERRATIAAVGVAVDEIAPGAARGGVSVSVDVDPQ